MLLRGNEAKSISCGDIRRHSQTFFLECRVPNRQYLIHDENLRFQMRSQLRTRDHIHPAAVALCGRVDKLPNFSECNDLLEFPLDLALSHIKDCAVQVEIFPPCGGLDLANFAYRCHPLGSSISK